MRKTLNRQFKRYLAVPYGCYKLASSRRSFLRQSGWFESLRTSAPRAADGAAIPWMNYAMVGLLGARLSHVMDVFEYGSGYSTCFFAQRARSVVSVEYNHAWHKQVTTIVPDNADVIYQPLDGTDAYVNTIREQPTRFDLVVVDGQQRVACMQTAAAQLKEGGVIVLDDSDRPEYAAGIDALRQQGFRPLAIAGLKPGSASRHESTIFYRRHNCLDL